MPAITRTNRYSRNKSAIIIASLTMGHDGNLLCNSNLARHYHSNITFDDVCEWEITIYRMKKKNVQGRKSKKNKKRYSPDLSDESDVV